MQAPRTDRPHAALGENLVRGHGFEDLRVEGELPKGLRGTLYRTGPGLYERFGKRLEHPFEADAVLSAVRFDGEGGARGAARVLETPGYLEEEAAGRMLYSSGTPWLRRFIHGLQQKQKNTGNTAIWAWRDQVYALLETAPPIAFDAETLAFQREDDLDGAVVRSFSAHPTRVAKLRTWFNFGLRFGKETVLDLYAFPERPEDGAARRIGCVDLPWPGFVHDFVATENYLVFFVCPGRLAMGRALLQLGSFADWFQWRPQDGTQIIVVPLASADDPSTHRRFDAESFWVWHFVNGFEDRGELVIDYCRYPNLDSLDAIGSGKAIAPPILHRARVNPQGKGSRAFVSEARWDVACEFPRILPARSGSAHGPTWMQTSSDPDHYGLARVALGSDADPSGDAVSVQRWIPEAHQRPSEPIPVAREGEGSWVVSLCHDELAGASFVAVLDGDAMEAGPVAKVWFDHPVPQTFHGAWVG